jgi:hypothetical protein
VYFVLEPLKTTEPTLQQCTLKWEMLILRAHSHPGVHILGNVFTVKLWKGAVLPHPLSILTPYLGSENHHQHQLSHNEEHLWWGYENTS